MYRIWHSCQSLQNCNCSLDVLQKSERAKPIKNEKRHINLESSHANTSLTRRRQGKVARIAGLAGHLELPRSGRAATALDADESFDELRLRVGERRGLLLFADERGAASDGAVATSAPAAADGLRRAAVENLRSEKRGRRRRRVELKPVDAGRHRRRRWREIL